jgi:Ca2+-binding EF-hand superfamily protein
MDSNGDGAISQSEMESYIQKQGGTVAEADALFSGLNQGGTGNLTQTQLASDLQQANGAGGHHYHHHGLPSADQVGNDLVKAMDTNGNGAVDQSEFQQFVTGLGGTTAQATTDFAALDPNNTGSINAAQFSTAVQAFESASSAASTTSNGTSPILTLLNGFAQNATATTSSTSIMA